MTTSFGGMNIVNRAAAATAGGAGGGNRTVLITGVGKGLGRALALEIAKRGHTVVGCSRSQDRLTSLQSELSSVASSPQSDSAVSSSDRHFFMTVDVRSNSSVEELARAVMEKKGVPDIIGQLGIGRLIRDHSSGVLRAFSSLAIEAEILALLEELLLAKTLSISNFLIEGTINRNNRIWEVPEEEFDTVIDTNVKGTANVMRQFIPLMIENKQGIIVNMSSGWGRSAAAQVAPYCASKWAVEGLSRSVAKELPSGLAIVALNPGVINTDMLMSCFGGSAALYQTPEAWAPKAASMILNLTAADNGASLTV
uniref:NADPH-dependent pterin aldehyde reductase n=1 Tax=Vitis vinifera TaxID=29760 RepID=A5AMK9_VITVI|nr:hypothetical protein VITISV_019435 [Vitis vinifera]